MVVMNDQVSHLILCFSSEKLLSAFSSVLLLLRSGNLIIKKIKKMMIVLLCFIESLYCENVILLSKCIIIIHQ